MFVSTVSLREWLWAAWQRVVCLVQFYFLISSKVATGTSWCLWTDWRLDVPQLVLGLSCNLPENFVPAWHQVGRQLWYQLGRHPMDVKPQFELNQQPAITGGQVLCTTSGNALTVTLIAGNERHSFCLRAVTGSVKISNIVLQPPPPPLSGTSPWVVDFGLLQCRLHFFSWSYMKGGMEPIRQLMIMAKDKLYSCCSPETESFYYLTSENAVWPNIFLLQIFSSNWQRKTYKGQNIDKSQHCFFGLVRHYLYIFP